MTYNDLGAIPKPHRSPRQFSAIWPIMVAVSILSAVTILVVLIIGVTT